MFGQQTPAFVREFNRIVREKEGGPGRMRRLKCWLGLHERRIVGSSFEPYVWIGCAHCHLYEGRVHIHNVPGIALRREE